MKEQVNFLRYNPNLYISPVKKNFGIDNSRPIRIKQLALSIINEHLNPLFYLFNANFPDEPKLELKLKIYGTYFQIIANPYIPALSRGSGFKELSLLVSALEDIVTLAPYYCFEARGKEGYWSFVKFFGEAAEKEKLINEINSRSQRNQADILVKAKVSKINNIQGTQYLSNSKNPVPSPICICNSDMQGIS